MKKTLAWLLMAALLLTSAPALADGFSWITTTPAPTAPTAPTTTFFAYTLVDEDASPKLENIQRAAWSINRTTISWGETFSFNGIVGPRTGEYGYKAALNGRGARVYGGGVAQTAATLYLALLQLPADSVEFESLEFYGKSYSDDYVASGDQAVLVDYNNDIDFAFTNYAAKEMTIEMWISEGYLCCSVSLGGDNSWHHPGLPQANRIASAQIYCGSDANLLSNVALAAGSIYDTTLSGGDVFSFNETVGPRTKEWGYVSAINGRGAKVVGGGVAQVASALWLCVKELDDFAVTAKSTYGQNYNQSYVDNSADAIVTDYKAGTDFAFRYTGEGCVTIYTWLDGSVLCCEIYRSE